MKKYLFGLSAVVFALVLVSFSANRQSFTTFIYNVPGSNPYDEVNVEDETKWILTGTACTVDDQEKACTIKVLSSLVSGAGSTLFAKSSNNVRIAADEFTAVDVAEVSDVTNAAGTSLGTNKQIFNALQ